MKKLISLILILCLAAGIAPAFGESAAAEDENIPGILGGWTIISCEAQELPEDAMTAFRTATETMDGAQYIPVALLATQPVAGINYCILCQIVPVVPDPEPGWALVYIYADLQGNAEIMNVYELYIDRHSTPKE